jgi:hypothetical protein
VAEEVERLKDLYVPVSPKQGRLLYLVARSLRAQRIVEFGTSFGISTTYLAAAVRDNGGGVVVGSELEPGKVATARRHLEEAGLSTFVDIREGDAQETLKNPGGTVDTYGKWLPMGNKAAVDALDSPSGSKVVATRGQGAVDAPQTTDFARATRRSRTGDLLTTKLARLVTV